MCFCVFIKLIVDSFCHLSPCSRSLNTTSLPPRYKRAHEVLFGKSMEVSERFNKEQGICLLNKIFEVYQDRAEYTGGCGHVRVAVFPAAVVS